MLVPTGSDADDAAPFGAASLVSAGRLGLAFGQEAPDEVGA